MHTTFVNAENEPVGDPSAHLHFHLVIFHIILLTASHCSVRPCTVCQCFVSCIKQTARLAAEKKHLTNSTFSHLSFIACPTERDSKEVLLQTATMKKKTHTLSYRFESCHTKIWRAVCNYADTLWSVFCSVIASDARPAQRLSRNFICILVFRVDSLISPHLLLLRSAHTPQQRRIGEKKTTRKPCQSWIFHTMETMFGIQFHDTIHKVHNKIVSFGAFLRFRPASHSALALRCAVPKEYDNKTINELTFKTRKN